MKRRLSHERVNGSPFTLIELLVVIAIIAILASILMPALSSARERGKAAVCVNNLKSMSGALHSYADDFRGIIVYQYVLPTGNPSYLSKLYDGKYLTNNKIYPSGNSGSYGRFNRVTFCPSSAFDPPYSDYSNAEYRVYGMLTLNGDNDYTATGNNKKELLGNIWFEQQLGSSSAQIRFYKVSNVKTPGSVTYFGESSYNSTAADPNKNRPCWQFIVGKTYGGAPHIKLQHNDRANMVFFDGHVAAQDRYQLRMSPLWVKMTNDANGVTFSLN